MHIALYPCRPSHPDFFRETLKIMGRPGYKAIMHMGPLIIIFITSKSHMYIICMPKAMISCYS